MKPQRTLRGAFARTAGTVGLVVLLMAPIARAARTALPGTVNYLEGQVAINGNELQSKQVGEAQVLPDQLLNTENGKAEMLLTPGVFVRVGSNSEVRLISNALAESRIEVLRGEAMVEVDSKPKQENLSVLQGGFSALVQKEGLYRFDADESRIGVLDGKLKVTGNGFDKDLKKGHEVALNGTTAQVSKFNTKQGDDLYRWSQLRSEYMAEANEASARTVYVNNGGWGNGWYWNPYFSSWAWLPGGGYFYSPFGYPFYSPGVIAYVPRTLVVPRMYGSPGRGVLPRGGGVPIHPRLNATRPQSFRPAPGGGHFAGGGMHLSGGGRFAGHR